MEKKPEKPNESILREIERQLVFLNSSFVAAFHVRSSLSFKSTVKKKDSFHETWYFLLFTNPLSS